MKKLIIKGFLIISFLIIVFASCKKDDNNDNDTYSFQTITYELRFTCTSDNPYLIEVNGNSDVVSGNSYITYKFAKGTYSYKCTQQSGYLLYPTVKEGTVNLNQDKEVVFP